VDHVTDQRETKRKRLLEQVPDCLADGKQRFGATFYDVERLVRQISQEFS